MVQSMTVNVILIYFLHFRCDSDKLLFLFPGAVGDGIEDCLVIQRILQLLKFLQGAAGELNGQRVIFSVRVVDKIPLPVLHKSALGLLKYAGLPGQNCGLS